MNVSMYVYYSFFVAQCVCMCAWEYDCRARFKPADCRARFKQNGVFNEFSTMGSVKYYRIKVFFEIVTRATFLRLPSKLNTNSYSSLQFCSVEFLEARLQREISKEGKNISMHL